MTCYRGSVSVDAHMLEKESLHLTIFALYEHPQNCDFTMHNMVFYKGDRITLSLQYLIRYTTTPHFIHVFMLTKSLWL